MGAAPQGCAGRAIKAPGLAFARRQCALLANGESRQGPSWLAPEDGKELNALQPRAYVLGEFGM